MKMSVRRLEPKDAGTAVAVVKLFAAQDISLAYAEKFLENPANYLIVAEADGLPAGFLLAYALPRLKQESHKLFIYEIDVGEDYRRQGIGTALINHIREVVEKEGMLNAFVLTSYSNKVAVEFYKSTGGEIVNGDDLMFVYESG